MLDERRNNTGLVGSFLARLPRRRSSKYFSPEKLAILKQVLYNIKYNLINE